VPQGIFILITDYVFGLENLDNPGMLS